MTRKAVYIAAGYAAGLMLAAYDIPLWGICALVVLCALMVLLFRADRGQIKGVTAAAVSAVIGFAVYTAADVPPAAGKYDFDAVICDADNGSYTVKLDGRPVGIYLYGGESFVRGDRVHISGELRASAARYGGNVGVMYSPQVTLISKGKIWHTTAALREAAIQDIRSLGAGDAGEYLIGLMFGSRYWDISGKGLSALHRSGAGHTASVSGLHMSVIAAFVTMLIRDRRARFIVMLFCGGAVVLAADAAVPVVRAYIMAAAVCASELTTRRADSLNSLCIAALAILIHSPLCVTGASFMLSFSGTLGAAVIYPEIHDYLIERRAAREGRDAEFVHMNAVLKTALFTMCIQLAVLPASLLFFDEISACAPMANLVAVPLCTPALLLAYTAAMFPHGTFAMVIYTLAAVPAKAVLTLCGALSDISAPLPAGMIPAWAVSGAVVVCIAALIGGRKVFIPAAVTSLSLLLIIGAANYALHSGRTEVIVLDGCAVIRTSHGGAVVDTGDHRSIVRSAAARNGISPSAVFCRYDAAERYALVYPGAKIYNSHDTYAADGVIIEYSGDTAVIHTGGEEDICLR